MNNFWQRTFTGIAFVGAILACILINEYAFYALFLIFTAITSYEFYSIVEKNDNVSLNKFWAVTASLILFSGCFFGLKFSKIHSFIYIYVLLLIGLVIYELFRKKTNPIHDWAYLFLGQTFIALPFALLNFLVFPFGQDFSPIFLIILFLIIWINDTGAYLFGITFGKHRLFERISPKKSWEGFFGGLILALTFAYFIPDLLPLCGISAEEMNRFKWLGFVLVVAISGTFGDLIESLLKRTVNIKDSGEILPGHGGLLDRFDSLLLAAPVAFIYLQFVSPLLN
jgi:phosphatidate cytidylyltransferase